jgi:hypothetical protein
VAESPAGIREHIESQADRFKQEATKLFSLEEGAGLSEGQFAARRPVVATAPSLIATAPSLIAKDQAVVTAVKPPATAGPAAVVAKQPTVAAAQPAVTTVQPASRPLLFSRVRRPVLQGAAGPLQGAAGPLQGAAGPLQGAAGPLQSTSDPEKRHEVATSQTGASTFPCF